MLLPEKKAPILPNEILVVTDDTARHSMPWLKGSISVRPLTVRELVRLVAVHPTLEIWLDARREFSSPEDLVEVVGRAAIIDLVSLSMGRAKWRLRFLPDIALVHALVFISEISTGLRLVTDFWLDKPKTVFEPPLAEGEIRRRDPADTRLLDMVRSAAEYTARTGREGLDRSPAVLSFAVRAFAEIDRDARINAARAYAATQSLEAATAVAEI